MSPAAYTPPPAAHIVYAEEDTMSPGAYVVPPVTYNVPTRAPFSGAGG